MLPASPAAAPPPPAQLPAIATTITPGSAPHRALIQRMTNHRTLPRHIEDWGNASDGDAQRATLALFGAVIRSDAPAVWTAVHAGAALNAHLKPEVLPETRDKEGRQVVPSLVTALGIAWWNQTHDDHGRSVSRPARDDRALPNLGVVEALLTAGAPAESNLLRLVDASGWEFHPAFEALEQAVLNRLAQPEDTGVPVPTEALPGVPMAVGQTPLHGRHLWSHRAVLHGHWPALAAWFERGGVVSTPVTERLLPMLWDRTPMNRPVGGPPADQDAVLTAIDQVRPALLAADDEVYRREVLGAMARVTASVLHHREHPVHGPAGARALAWLVNLMEERPLDLTLTAQDHRPTDRWLLPMSTSQFRAMAQTVEALMLRRVADREAPEAGALRGRPRL